LVTEYKEWLRNDAVIIAQIEHINAVNELSGILDVPGIDGIIVGPYDLSASMGYPGEFDRLDVVEALKRVDSICIEKGRPLGFHVISSDHTKTLEKINIGYTFLAMSLDFFFLGDSARREMSKLRKATKS